MPKFNQEEIESTLSPQFFARRHKKQARCAGKFIKGPIPLTWWTTAAALPGKALALASAIWFKAGISSTTTNIVVGEQLAKQFGVHRGARYRALDELQAAGLISVDQKPGSVPRVSLITKTKATKRKTPTTWSQAI